MKILIFGSNGQVGVALSDLFFKENLILPTREDINLFKYRLLDSYIKKINPDLIINAAAYTNVDLAESERELAFILNRDVPKKIAIISKELNIPFIHFSTDYVFDGKKDIAYTELDKENPLSVYGISKFEGDQEIQLIGGNFFIFRISWVYSNVRKNFYLTIINMYKKNKKLKVINDQFGVPTSNYFIAENIHKIIPLLSKSKPGVYNLVPDGYCSWFDFAYEIIKKKYNSSNISAISSKDYQFSAPRPANSILDNSKFKKTFMLEFNEWKFELDKIINES